MTSCEQIRVRAVGLTVLVTQVYAEFDVVRFTIAMKKVAPLLQWVERSCLPTREV